jgi:hypothetical protein
MVSVLAQPASKESRAKRLSRRFIQGFPKTNVGVSLLAIAQCQTPEK